MVLAEYSFIIFLDLNFGSLTNALVMDGMYEETSSFVGLSLDVPDLTKLRCSTRFVYSFDIGLDFTAVCVLTVCR